MSTIDKLKAKLNFDKEANGFNSGIGAATEAVTVKFSHMQMSIQHQLDKIVDAAFTTGKRIVSALTIDPIKTGLSEYETKINAIQVIQSNTRSHYTDEEIASGKQMDDITSALDDLNTYADKTIYNFAQMTSNVGKFVAQGLTTKQATKAVQGLANLAAASGASAEDMSRATYQMSQALGGTIRLMDWNSLRNANMATVDLKNTLIDLAKVNGIAIDDMIKKHGTFEQTLQEGWLSGSMFSEAMEIYSGVYSEEQLKAKGFTDEQVKNFIDLAKNAESAATEVKTFTQLWDVLKETAQSGWTQTWELIIGDFDSAKKTLTQLQVYFSGIIEGWSKTRNFILEAALNFTDPWKKITEKLNGGSLGKIKDVADTIGDAADKVEYFQNVVNKVWRGDYKNKDTGRFDLLTKAGYDHRVVQDLVNKGYQYKITAEDIEASHKKFGLTFDKTTESTKETTEALEKLTDEQLKNAGLTEDEISLYKALSKEAERTGVSFDELVKSMSEKDGRTLLIESFKNLWSGISGVIKSIKEAFVEIFNPPGSGELVIFLYNVITAINKFSESLRLTRKDNGDLNDNGKKLLRTFKGIFAIISIVTNILGGGLKIAFKILSQFLGVFHLNILDVTAAVGDALVVFADWVNDLLDFTEIFEAIKPYVEDAAAAIRKWNDEVQPLKQVGDFFKNMADGIKTWLAGIKDAENVPKYIIEGLVNGLKNGVSTVATAVWNIGKTIIEAICGVLGIASPSKEMEKVGAWTMEGLFNGLKQGVSMVWRFLVAVGEKAIEIVENFSLGGAIAAALGGGLLVALFKILNIVEGFMGTFESIKDKFVGILESFSDAIDAWALNQKSEAVKNFAWSVAILAGSIFLLSLIDTGKMWSCVGALAALAGIILGLTYLMGKMDQIDKFEFPSFKILGLAAALLVLAFALQRLSGISGDDALKSIGMLAAIIGGVIGLIAAIGKLLTPGTEKEISRIGGALLKISLGILLISVAMKLVASMSPADMAKGIIAITAFGGVITGLIAATKLAGGPGNGIGGMILKMSVAILLMAATMKLIATIDPADAFKGVVVITAFGGIITGLIAATKLAGANSIGRLGFMLLGVSAAMVLMTLAVAILSKIKTADIVKGILIITAFGGIITGLIAATKLAGDQLIKTSFLLIVLSGCLAVLAAIIVALSIMDPAGIARGLIVVTLLSGLVVGLLYAVKGAEKCQANLIALAIAIGALALSVAILTKVDSHKLIGATAAMVAVLGMLALVIRTSSSMGQTMDFKGLIAITVAIAALAATLITLSALNAKNVATAGVTLVSVLGAVTLLMYGMSALSKTANLGAMMQSLLPITAIIALLGGLLWALSALEVDVSFGTLAGLSLLLGTLTGVITALKFLGKAITAKDSKSITESIIALTSLVIPLGAFALVLSSLNGSDWSTENITALGAMMIVMTGVLAAVTGLAKVLSTMGKGWALLDFTVIIAGLAVLGLILWEFAAILGASSGQLKKLEGLEKPLLSVAGVMLAMVGVLAVLTVLGKYMLNTPMDYAGLGIALAGFALFGLVMWEFLAIFGGMAGALKKLNGLEKPLATFTVVLLGMVGVMTAMIPLTALMLIGPWAYAGLGIVIAAFALFGLVMWEFLGILGGMAGALRKLDGLERPLATFTVVLTAMIGVMSLLGLCCVYVTLGIIGAIGLAAFGLVLWEFAAILGSSAENLKKLEGLEKPLNTVIGVMTSLTVLLVALGFVGPLLSTALPGIIGLIAFTTVLGTLAGAIGWLVNEFPSLKKFIDEGMPILGSLATGLGTIIGNFISGTIASASEFLPEVGTNLSEFMTNIKSFVDGARNIDEAVVTGVGNLAKAVLILCAADFINGLNSYISEDGIISGLGHFGTELSEFAKNLQPFIEYTKNIDPAIMTGIKALAEAVLIFTASDVLNGLTSWLTGGNSIAKFGEDIGGLATCFNTFTTNLGDFSEAEVKKAANAAEVIKVLAEAAETIPNDGGWAGKIFGENSLGTFAEAIAKTGTSISSFATSVSGLSDTSVQKAGLATNIIKNLAEAAKSIPSDGGWAGAIFGENSLATFADNMPTVGSNIASFATSIANIPDGVDAKAKSAAAIITELGKAADAIPNEGGIWSALFGDNSLATFCDKLPDVGSNISGFCTNIGSLDDSSVSAVTSATDIIDALANLTALDLLGKSVSITTFGGVLPKVGENIATFVNEISGASDNANKAIAVTNSIVGLAKSMASTNIESLKTFGKSLKDIATEGVNGFVDAFNGKTPKDTVKKAAADLAQKVLDGFESKEKDAEKAIKKVADAAIDELKSKSLKKDFEGAGKYAVEGYANGIKNNKKLASDAGSALGKAALEAAKKALDENSPSKEFYKVGDFGGIGFVNALLDNVSSAYKAGGTMADSARKGLSGAIARITDTLANEMDMQPTIRPVLDLSDVRSGAGSINGLFSGGTLNVNSAHVGAISASMAKRQNGNDNSDIVSGIKALRKDIAGMERNVYHIDGVTYDDGSNVADAVSALARAIKIERRS
jgi:tape measure domain-containing protein